MNAEPNKKNWWNLELEGKPDFEMSMKRIYAWYEGEVIDRVPLRFSAHNSFVSEKHANRNWKDIKDKWFDVEFQVESFIKSIEGKKFLAETFPVYWPNLGPNVFAAFYGSRLEYDEVTSWAGHCIQDWEDLYRLRLNVESEYFKKIEELMECALERCGSRFMVGYTDLHPGLDCVAAWRDTQKLLFDFYDNPGEVKEAIEIAVSDFQKVYDHFDSMLKRKKQLSITWMGIPSFGKMHIPSCDFSAMLSNQDFIEYCLPVLHREVKPMTHNIFHLDGKDVARHIDTILEVPEIQAIQWVQGVGEEKPIMMWIPLIQKIRAAGKSVVVDLDKSELDEFISVMNPEGLLLCIDSKDEAEQKEILKRVEKW
jgi:hypothetical protein